jgi:signal transduction histidine kinase
LIVAGQVVSDLARRAASLIAFLRERPFGGPRTRGEVARIAEAVRRERLQVARDLHDGVVQHLWAVSLELEALQALIDNGDMAAVRDQARRADVGVSRAAEDARRTIAVLRGVPASPTLLADALAGRLQELADRWGYHVELRNDGALSDLADSFHAELSGISDEALTNIQKHADASRIVVTLRRTEAGREMSIADDGRGFDQSAVAGRGVGLIGMEERAHRIGARFGVWSDARTGTRVTVVLP